MMSHKSVDEIIHEAIKKHARLSDFDDKAIQAEVNAIRKALDKHGVIFGRRGI
jgi:hypothetical protein